MTSRVPVLAQPSPVPSLGFLDVSLRGHLTQERLQGALLEADRALDASSSSVRLIVDCREMSGYDTEARDFFVAWNTRMRARIAKLAVVTERKMWHLVVSGMALASGQRMKAFDDRASALIWLK
jgi:SpoIIAA-like